MVTYASSRPGVYLEDVPLPPSAPFRTAVPVFLGRGAAPSGTQAAPSVTQLDASSWSELEQKSGAGWAPGYLGLAVRGFFQNGGRLCYVVPLSDSSGLEEALVALSKISDFDLVCAPDLAEWDAVALVAAQARLLALCAERGDCFAILDSAPSPSPDVITGAVAHREALDAAIRAAARARGLPPEALRSNGALYFPWISVPDGGGSGESGLVPPSGHVAGVYAEMDQGVGVHKAPANVALQGVVDLQALLSAGEEERLNPDGVMSTNCLRAFTGRGIRIWGARTLSLEPAWLPVSVRRLVLTIGRWLDATLSGLAFEPNDLGLWNRTGREVTAFLDDLYRQGAFRGSTPDEAYYVKCDAETNPPAVRDLGQLVTEIGIAPETPKEFLVVRLVHDDTGISVTSAAP